MRTVTLTAVIGAALALAGCGGSSSSSSSSTAAPASSAAATDAAAATVAAAAGAQVAVTESEFKIDLPATAVKAGTVTFAVKNAGSFGHDLTIDGPGVAGKGSGTIAGGADGTLTVDLKPGTYTLYCSIDGHRASGMETTITVG